MQGSGNYPLPLEDSQCSVPHGWFQGLSLGSFFSLSLWHIPWHMVSRAPSASASGWLEEPWTSNISVWHHPLAQTFHNSSAAAAHSKSSTAVIFTQQPEGEKREEREEIRWVITQWTAAEVSNASPIFTNCAPQPVSVTESKRDCTKNLASILGAPTWSLSCSPSTSTWLFWTSQLFLLLQSLSTILSLFSCLFAELFLYLRC